MTKNIEIERKESITITNPIWGDINISLGTDGIYMIKGMPSARFSVIEKHTGPKIEQTVIVKNNSTDANKEEDSEPQFINQQIAFSNMKVDDDFIVSNISQSVRLS